MTENVPSWDRKAAMDDHADAFLALPGGEPPVEALAEDWTDASGGP
jgi:predicted Rossmann-fold nucleotide-binding protein